MRILVVGAGATGGYFGARLQQAGRDVTFLVRPGRAAALRERGLRVTGHDGSRAVLTPRLVTAADLTAGAATPAGGGAAGYDLAIVSVKASALPAALDDLAGAVGPGTAIVPFLNGMAHLDALNDRFGAGSVLGGVVRVFTALDAEGGIRQFAPLADLVIGEQGGGGSERVERLRGVLDGAGFDVTVCTDIVRAMWHKWVFISSLGALNTLGRGSVGEVAAVPGGGQLAGRILAEAAAVAAAAGYPMSPSALAQTTALLTAAGTATASLYRDLSAGLPTEGEHIFGDLTARARTLDVDTPLLDLVTLGLRVHERRAAQPNQVRP